MRSAVEDISDRGIRHAEHGGNCLLGFGAPEFSNPPNLFLLEAAFPSMGGANGRSVSAAVHGILGFGFPRQVLRICAAQVSVSARVGRLMMWRRRRSMCEFAHISMRVIMVPLVTEYRVSGHHSFQWIYQAIVTGIIDVLVYPSDAPPLALVVCVVCHPMSCSQVSAHQGG